MSRSVQDAPKKEWQMGNHAMVMENRVLADDMWLKQETDDGKLQILSVEGLGWSYALDKEAEKTLKSLEGKGLELDFGLDDVDPATNVKLMTVEVPLTTAYGYSPKKSKPMIDCCWTVYGISVPLLQSIRMLCQNQRALAVGNRCLQMILKAFEKDYIHQRWASLTDTFMI
ncbi:hypothetical protein EDD85DRAFT_790769 [Armillaria nabsnona]|nr:hypothetical protein EDD85DRAFT_790769 [Armillaria nabsnona]